MRTLMGIFPLRNTASYYMSLMTRKENNMDSKKTLIALSMLALRAKGSKDTLKEKEFQALATMLTAEAEHLKKELTQ